MTTMSRVPHTAPCTPWVPRHFPRSFEEDVITMRTTTTTTTTTTSTTSTTSATTKTQ